MPRAARHLLLAALLPGVSGCTVIAVTGAAAGAGVAVGKGVVNVASAPFGSEKDK